MNQFPLSGPAHSKASSSVYSTFRLIVSIALTVSSASVSEGLILRPPTSGCPSPPTFSCPARSRCSLILLSMYSFLSSRIVSIAAGSTGCERVASFGRNCFSILCRAGNCDRIKVVFVVRGVCFACGPVTAPTRRCCAAGPDVRKERSKSGRSVSW